MRAPSRGDLGVGPEQVGSLGEASDRGLVAESGVSSLMVVVPEPAVKCIGALCAGAVDGGVGPACEQCADEALCFAIVERCRLRLIQLMSSESSA